MRNVAIVQYDDRPDEALGPLNALRARNALYAKMHGYHYEFARQPAKDVPSYWNKVFLIEKFLNSGFDTVAWLDTDAVVHDFSISLESFFRQGEGLVFSSDLPIWIATSPLNAGVLFAKGDFGRALMREWQSLYPADLWKKKEDGSWNADEHVWAGPAFEQGCFALKLYPKYAAHPALKQLSWQVLQSPYPVKESFTLHFPRMLRPNCLLYLRQLAEQDAAAAPAAGFRIGV